MTRSIARLNLALFFFEMLVTLLQKSLNNLLEAPSVD